MQASTRLAGATVVLFLSAAPSLADGGFGILIGNSKHGEGSTLNDETPGAGFGYRWDTRHERLEFNTQAFVFQNSYEEISPSLMVGASYEFLELGPVSFHAGLSIGTARYEKLSSWKNLQSDIPDWNGYIPAALLSVETRVLDRVGARVSVTPVDGKDRAYNASMLFYFGD